MMRKQNVQNVHDKGCSNQGKHETFKREDRTVDASGRKDRPDTETHRRKSAMAGIGTEIEQLFICS